VRAAVITRVRPATDTRPSRLVAEGEQGRVSVEWDYGASAERNHGRALLAWQHKHGEELPRHGGWLPQGAAAWVALW